jgi:hypothetical protein
LFPGRPRRVFLASSCFFFGGIVFFESERGDEWNEELKTGDGADAVARAGPERRTRRESVGREREVGVKRGVLLTRK